MLSLTAEEKAAWLRLWRSDGIGPRTFWALLDRYPSAQAALERLPQLLHAGSSRTRIVLATEQACSEERGQIDAIGAQLLAWGEPDFPQGLARLDPSPPLITVKGKRAVLAAPAIAVVGARNASALGRQFARTVSEQLGQAGFSVVSGLARGIDTAAHEGALQTGTVAVLAGGIDVPYPPENRDLAQRLLEQGALVTEMPFGTQPQARHFPRRNRIIAGMSLGVVVVEAALGSGSLITARYAVESNREVFAVPGSPLDPRARGSNDLIRQGATLTEGLSDIMEILRPALARPSAPSINPGPANWTSIDATDPALTRRLLDLLGPAPVDMDELTRQLRVSAAELAAAVLELEILGQARRHPGNQVSQT